MKLTEVYCWWSLHTADTGFLAGSRCKQSPIITTKGPFQKRLPIFVIQLACITNGAFITDEYFHQCERLQFSEDMKVRAEIPVVCGSKGLLSASFGRHFLSLSPPTCPFVSLTVLWQLKHWKSSRSWFAKCDEVQCKKQVSLFAKNVLLAVYL